MARIAGKITEQAVQDMKCAAKRLIALHAVRRNQVIGNAESRAPAAR